MIEASCSVVHGKRLLDIDGLTRLEGLLRVSAVAIVPGCDRHRVDLRILEDFCSVGGCVAESDSAGQAPLRSFPRAVQIVTRLKSLSVVKMRKKHRFRVVSGSDHAEPDLLEGGRRSQNE